MKIKFKGFQQCFITPITKESNNSKILNMTFKELITTDFSIKFKNYLKDIHASEINNYRKKQEIIKYFDQIEDIGKKIHFDFISNLTYKGLFNEYLESKEFEEDILNLKKKGESEKYIKEYILMAYKFIDYYSRSN